MLHSEDDPRLEAAREDVALLADWLARTGRDVPPAYRLLLATEPRTRARGQERVAAARAHVLDGSLDELTCLVLARDDLSRLAAPATAEGLRAAERPRDPLFVARRRELHAIESALGLHLSWAGVALVLALLIPGAVIGGLLGGAAGIGALLALLAGIRRDRLRRACHERRWSPVARPDPGGHR